MSEELNEQQSSNIDIKNIIGVCLSKWYWFAISAAVALLIGVYIALSAVPQYERKMKVLIKTDTQGGGSVMGDLAATGTFGNFGGLANNSVGNEIQAFSSTDIMTEVVKRLDLDMEYTEKGLLHDNVKYGAELPVKVKLIDVEAEDVATFKMQVTPSRSVTLSEFVLNNEVKGEKGRALSVKIGDTVKSPIGRLCVYQTGAFDTVAHTIKVSKAPMTLTVKGYMASTTAARADKQADVIDLTIATNSKAKGDDVLDTIMVVYNEQWIKDKNKIAESTSKFINERLQVIERELSGVDEDISTYKSANKLPDVKAAATLYMGESSTLASQIMEIDNQLYVAQYIRDYLVDKANNTSTIPAISGINNSSMDQQIAEYNGQILRRNNLVAQSSEKNSLVQSADRALETMRQSIIASMDNNIYALKSQLNNLKQNEAKINSRISANPTQAKQLLSVERQQAVKESLYLYLLQKREENELSQAFTAYNTRIIENPTGPAVPKSPRKRLIVLVALVIGLALPAGVIFLMETLNTRVRGREDVESLSVPFVGEIPAIEQPGDRKLKARLTKWSDRWLGKFKKAKKKAVTKSIIVVEEGNRNVYNEAFRVVRTNLEYLAKNSGESNCVVFQMTSMNAGSGKSFITNNIAICLALRKKKILMIDGDLRHATLSASVNSPHKGIANYLNEQIELDGVKGLMCKFPGHESLDVLPVGKIPPNPTELVGNGRLAALLEYLRPDYDYIFIDCPPVDIVADTQIISREVDRTIFVVRAGLLERDLVPDIQKMADTGKLTNMVLLLNGTKYEGGGYYYGKRRGYGYHYGYSHDYYASND